ncbi:ABC transporter ATP-binding protein [Bacillus horti]|uniref:ABC transport system ATP-binding protein n=1 Tax=Caldalkalibacillus horti TaxID=77523 RepID=A0ABT9VUU0_9BACI|nr:ABC transporter ATP-binding protein [Bacillus horti]MDQ0164758.1 putative ABC transport system ATP-binding protein [Bacillus horti]
MGVILESKELSKVYSVDKENKQDILKNVNLQINKGEFVSVMGPSGSGKSTLLYNISGMDRLTSGSVQFNGQEISTFSEQELSTLRLNKMGFIFQQIHLLKNLNIFDNIVLSAYLAKKDSRKSINKRATELMKRTNISSLADHDVTQASGGQLQRVAICRALINQPDIVFGDEPTGALNSKSADEVMEILADINQTGTTIMLVTHDVKVAAKTERILYMLDGNIVGEYQLGKYRKEKNDSRAREEEVSRWLMKLGF